MTKKDATKMKHSGKPITFVIKKQINLRSIPYIHLVVTFLFINVISVIFLVLFSKNLPPQVPLYYGLPRSDKQLVQPVVLILPILFSSLFITINSILTLFLKSTFLKDVLVISGLFISILASITVIRIIMTIIGI